MRSGPVTRDTSTVALGLAQIRVGNSAANISEIDPVLTASDSIGALANTKYTGSTDWFKLESGFPLLEDLVLPIREGASLECAFKEITPYNLALAYGLDPTSGRQNATYTAGTITSSAGTTTGDIGVDNNGGVITDTFTVTFSSATDYAVSGATAGSVGNGSIGAAFSPDNGGNPYFTIPATFFSGTWANGDTFTFNTTAYVAGAFDDPHDGSINLGARVAPKSVRVEAVYTYPNGTNHMYIIFPRGQVSANTEIDLQAEDAAAVPLVFEGKRADSETQGGSAAWDNAPIGRIVFD